MKHAQIELNLRGSHLAPHRGGRGALALASRMCLVDPTASSDHLHQVMSQEHLVSMADPSWDDMSTVNRWLTWAFSPAISAILVTLVVSLLSPILIHWYLYKTAVAKEPPSIILLGPSGAGKTSLLTLVPFSNSSRLHQDID